MAAYKIQPFTISVPASSANFGPGLDCFGLALSLRLTLKCQLNEGSGGGAIKIYDSSPTIVKGMLLNDKDRIIQVAELVAKQHERDLLTSNQSLFINIRNEIPVERGLGSSAAITVAGIALASKVLNLGLPKEEIFKIALKFKESSAANIASAVFGKFNVLIKGDHETDFLGHVELKWPESWGLVVRISDWEVPADFAEKVLPESYAREAVVGNTSRAAGLVACLCAGNYSPLIICLQDELHQYYRAELVPETRKLLHLPAPDRWSSVFGSCFSGTGHSILGISSSYYRFDASFKSRLEDSNIHSGNVIGITADYTGLALDEKSIHL